MSGGFGGGAGRGMALPGAMMNKGQEIITSTRSPLNDQNEKAADAAPRVRSDFPETWLWADANVKLGTVFKQVVKITCFFCAFL